MPITTPQGFDLQNSEPLEAKTVQTDAPIADSLEAIRYDGLTVYSTATQKEYQWQGPRLAGAWFEKVTDGFAVGEFIATSNGAADSGKPIVLDANGKIDSSMLTASDLSLYYLLNGSNALEGNMNAYNGTTNYKITNLAAGTANGDSIRYEQVIGQYLPIDGVAVNSSQLEGNSASFFTNASNISSGEIHNDYLPATITAAISGNATTATTWASAVNITLTGDVLGGPIPLDGSINIEIPTTMSSHEHDAGDITGTLTAFNRNFTTASGTNGTTTDVARGDHSHTAFSSGITVNTTWKDKDNTNRYGKFIDGVITETGAWVPMSGYISETTVQGQDATTQDVTLVYQMDPIESTGYTFQYVSGNSIVMFTTGETGTGNTTATVTLAGSVGMSTIWELVDNYTGTQLDTVTIEIIA